MLGRAVERVGFELELRESEIRVGELGLGLKLGS